MVLHHVLPPKKELSGDIQVFCHRDFYGGAQKHNRNGSSKSKNSFQFIPWNPSIIQIFGQNIHVSQFVSRVVRNKQHGQEEPRKKNFIYHYISSHYRNKKKDKM